MNHRREGDSRQKRKISDLDYGLGPAENDLFRLPRRPFEHPQNRLTYASVVSGQRTKDSGKAMTPMVVTVPDTVKNLECGCCFGDYPPSELTFCSAPTPHLFCFNCAKRYAEEEIIKARFNLGCMDVSGCTATFSEREIQRFLDKRGYERFDQLRTDDVIRQAGLDGLVNCPFCPFAAIMEDPTDKEFPCERCRIISCRDCRVKSHRPLSCEDYQKEKKLTPAKIIEEAMSEAMVRKCNKCGLRFVKLDGCNKITCRCGNTQCFVCSADVVGYNHFDRVVGTTLLCPMYCDSAKLLETDVAKARVETVERLRRTRGDMNGKRRRVDIDLTVSTEASRSASPFPPMTVPPTKEVQAIFEDLFGRGVTAPEFRRGIENLRPPGGNGRHGALHIPGTNMMQAQRNDPPQGPPLINHIQPPVHPIPGQNQPNLIGNIAPAPNFPPLNPHPHQMFAPWPAPPGYPFQNNPPQNGPNGQYFPFQAPTGYAPPAPAYTGFSLNTMPVPPQPPWYHFHPQQPQQPPPFPEPHQQPPQQPQPPYHYPTTHPPVIGYQNNPPQHFTQNPPHPFPPYPYNFQQNASAAPGWVTGQWN